MNFIGEWSSTIAEKGGVAKFFLPYIRWDKRSIKDIEMSLQFKDTFKVYDLVGRTKQGHYFLNSSTMAVHLEFIDASHLEGYYISKSDAGVIIIECETKCQGCLEDQPNQLAHMEMGGCLYSEN